MTYGELLGPAMEVTTQEEADREWDRMMGLMKNDYPADTDEARATILRNDLGYYAGYYDNSTRERVERLFGCAHPVFGAIATNPPPTPAEAFEMGKRIADQ